MISSEFYESYRNRHQLAEGWKRRGRKLVGYFCSLTPEELIYAAGLIPVRIRGTTENIGLADAHLPSFCCSYMRGALDQALKGQYGYLDGMVFPKTCDMPRALYHIWKRNLPLPYYWFLPLPGQGTDEAVEYTMHELGLFRESLEDFSGNRITSESLDCAIRVYNQNRSLVQEVYELGKRESPALSGSDVFAVEIAGLVMPKEEHSAMVRNLLRRLPEGSNSGQSGPRLMVTGNNFESIELLQTIEDCGGRIVINDLDTGSRYYGAGVAEDREPIRAIAERYLREVRCPCKHPAESILERILALAQSYRVKGVVTVVQKYCDTHLYDRPWIESRLREEGIPALFIEHSDTGWTSGRFRTMAQAFIELLE